MYMVLHIIRIVGYKADLQLIYLKLKSNFKKWWTGSYKGRKKTSSMFSSFSTMILYSVLAPWKSPLPTLCTRKTNQTPREDNSPEKLKNHICRL